MSIRSTEFPYFDYDSRPRSIESDLERTPNRPLSEFSTFVTNHLPLLLAQVRAEEIPAEKFRDFVEQEAEMAPDPRDLPSEDVAVARVDAQFAYNAVVHAEKNVGPKERFENLVVTPGPATTELATYFAQVTGRPRILTYEDYILDNPHEDMRTFSSGPALWSEAGFIAAHYHIEQHLELVIQNQRYAIDLLEAGDTGSSDLLDALQRAIYHWSFNQKFTVMLREMNQKDFEMFRLYVGEFVDPHTNATLKGASGQQSARIRETDFLLGGRALLSKPGSRYLKDFNETHDYFPRSGVDRLDEAYERSMDQRTLRSLVESREVSQEVVNAIDILSQRKDGWRQKHKDVVNYHLNTGDEEKDKDNKGTGGTDFNVYLREMRDDTRDL